MNPDQSQSLETRPAAELTAPSARPEDENPAVVYIAGLASPASRRTMRTALDNLAAMFTGGALHALTMDWAALRYQHAAAARSRLLERFPSPKTVNKHLSALRGVLKESWRLGLVSAEDYHRARDVANVRGSRLPAGRVVSTAEVRALFEAAAAEPAPINARDACLLALLFGAGLRRAELAALDVADVDAETGEVLVHGKGRKDRMVWLRNGALDALADWLAVRRDEPGPLLCGVTRGGNLVRGRLTTQAIYNRLRVLASAARTPKGMSPHDCRRTFITGILEATGDAITAARLAGHASVDTTLTYDRRDEKAKQKAAEALHVPYVRPVAA